MAKFQKGQSGNSAGKPRGAKDRRTEMRALLQPHADKLVKKVVDLALAGDVQALRICIDRIIPPVRERAVSVALPDTADAAGCADAQAKIVAAVAAGELLPGEGEALAGLVEHRRRAIETTEVMKRLEALEAKEGRRA